MTLPQASTEQQRIAALEAELAALRAEMQDFTYTVSHDLRASLRHVSSYVQLVQEDAGEQLAPEVQGFLQTAVDASRQMAQMLDGLLELSRLGSAPLQVQAVSLESLLLETLADVQAAQTAKATQTARSGQHTAPIDWQLADSLRGLPQVMAEAGYLRALLEQLLDNAVKFSAGQTQPQIGLRAELLGDRLQLFIQDNGVGYNPAYQEKLFRPFQRLHSARQFAGLGMGLALGARMVRRWDAGLAIEALPAGGALVRLELGCAALAAV